MRILHVLSAGFFAGSVSYAVHLAEVHRAQGHAVWLLSDAATLPTGATVLVQPISNRRPGQRLRNVARIRELVRREQIDVVHAHSRAASWVSYFALRGLPVPLVSTVHGRQHLHASTSLFDIYGDKVIAICENLRRHLVEEVRMRPEKIVALPNGIQFQPLAALPAAPAPEELRLAFIGRFNGGKGERAAELLHHVFPPLLRELPALRLALIGGELNQLPAPGKTALASLQAEFGPRVEVVGFTDDVPGWLTRTSLVIGAGRVAIEALGAGVPTLALGEALYAGPVVPETYEAAAATNFGDIAARFQPPTADYAQLLADARRLLLRPAPLPPELVVRVRQEYDLAHVAAQVLTVYQSARMKKAVPAYLPVLMYHKIPDQPLPSQHRIFVVKERFAAHLRFFRQQGFTPLTFLDYQAFAEGRQPLANFPKRPLILTFDDGYLDNYTNLLPLMQQYGYRGVLYLLGDFSIDHNEWDLLQNPSEPRSPLMNEDQKRAFVAAGWEIGAHTLHHARLPKLPPAEAAAEIAGSKIALEQRLGIEVVSFAYPYGSLTPDLKRLVQAAGFRYAVATDTGGLHLEDDRFQIFRVNMFPHETAASLRKKTAPWYRRYYRWKRGK